MIKYFFLELTKFRGWAGPSTVLRGKSQCSQRKQAAKVQGPGRSRCGVEREAAMVTTDARWLAKMQGPVRSRYSVEREAPMVTADSKMSKFAPCKNLFL